MASEAPSWADQWGAGGIGDMQEEDTAAKKDEDSKKKGNGFGKAALKGAKKFMSKGKDLFSKKTQKKDSPDS